MPLQALLPAFMLSELKTAFLIGFQIYLPFLVLDMVISSVLIAMGMMMLPPVLVSLPFKLLLFVLVDGWHLTIGMLIDSFQPFTESLTPARLGYARINCHGYTRRHRSGTPGDHDGLAGQLAGAGGRLGDRPGRSACCRR